MPNVNDRLTLYRRVDCAAKKEIYAPVAALGSDDALATAHLSHIRVEL
ncbi:Uncharacterised protein [Vibrio cholerae]|nr:Uncharacterised protein [Vibrio cholerae]CSD56915.1 Uncharacterised protein [Vibrio cholerae]